MKNIIVAFLLLSFSACHKSNINGVYIGYQEMCSTDSTGKKECYINASQPNWKWYHKVAMKIIDSAVFMDQDPVAIYKTDTVASASDGAFYYFKGKVNRKDDDIAINMVQTACDYCGERVEINKDGKWVKPKIVKTYKGYISGDNLIINGMLFTKTPKNIKLFSESR